MSRMYNAGVWVAERAPLLVGVISAVITLVSLTGRGIKYFVLICGFSLAVFGILMHGGKLFDEVDAYRSEIIRWLQCDPPRDNWYCDREMRALRHQQLLEATRKSQQR